MATGTLLEQDRPLDEQGFTGRIMLVATLKEAA
jgi:hypothetical protein